MNQLRKLFEVHFKGTFREKQVWFWSIFYPILLLVIFMLLFGKSGDSNFNAKVALVSADNNPASQTIRAGLAQLPILEWKDKEPVSREQAEQWVKDKDIDAAIVLPGEAANGTIELILNREKENSPTHLAMKSILDQFIQNATYQQAGIKPILALDTKFISVGEGDLTFIAFLLTGMIALAISQSGMFGLVDMVEMRRNGVLKRLMLTPVSMRMYGFAGMLVRLLLSIVQIVILSLIGVYGFGAVLHINVLPFIVMFAAGSIAFTAIGYLIASLSKTTESFFGLTNLVSFLMMFLSGIFFQVGSLPDFIKPISHVLPLTYFANGIRDTMLYNFGFGSLSFWSNLGILAAWGVVAFLLGSRFYKWKAEKR